MWAFIDFIWASVQSPWLWAPMGIALWIASWLYYFRGMIRTRIKETQPHRWGVDLQGRKVTAGKRPVI
jgi:hypothetical protein